MGSFYKKPNISDINGPFSVDSPTLVIDDVNNRVGIGTASPSNKLEVSDASTSSLALFKRAGVAGTAVVTVQAPGGASLNVDAGVPGAGQQATVGLLANSSMLGGIQGDNPDGNKIKLFAGNSPTAGKTISMPQTGGMVPPKMTTAAREAIVSPEEGLEVTDTDTHSKWYYNGTDWKEVATV